MQSKILTEIQIYREKLKKTFQDFPVQKSLGQNCFAFERQYKNNPEIIERAFFSISKKTDLIKFDNFRINLYFTDIDYLVKQLPGIDAKRHTFGPSVYSAWILEQNDILDSLHEFSSLDYVLENVRNTYYDKVLTSLDGLNCIHDVCCYYEDPVVQRDRIKNLIVGGGLMPVFYIADGQILKAEKMIKETIAYTEAELPNINMPIDIAMSKEILVRFYKLKEIVNTLLL